MSQPPDPISDPKRVAALRRAGLLDSPPEAQFDRLAAAASTVMKTSVGLVSVVAEDRHYLKSAQDPDGVFKAESEMTLAFSLCRYAVASGQPLVLTDARLREDFQDHPVVRSGQVVAYAGYPIVLATGEAIGTVCVLDTKAREWEEEQVAALGQLAREAADIIASQAIAADSKARLFAVKSGHVPARRLQKDDTAATGVVALLGRMEGRDLSEGQAANATPAELQAGLVAAALFFLKQLDTYVLSLDTQAPADDVEDQDRLRGALVTAQAALLRAVEAFDAQAGRSSDVNNEAQALRNGCAAFLEADVRRTQTALLFRRGEVALAEVERHAADASDAEQAMRLAVRQFAARPN